MRLRYSRQAVCLAARHRVVLVPSTRQQIFPARGSLPSRHLARSECALEHGRISSSVVIIVSIDLCVLKTDSSQLRQGVKFAVETVDGSLNIKVITILITIC